MTESDLIIQELETHTLSSNPETTQHLQPVENTFIKDAITEIVVGSISGAVGKLVEYPFDTIKVRLQYSQSLPKPLFTSTWNCILTSFEKEGFYNGFYKGISSPMIGSALEISSLFFSYKLAQDGLNLLKHNKIDAELNLSEKFLCGGLSGISTSFILTPVELIKVKYQVESLKGRNSNNTTNTVSIPQLVRRIYKNESLKGLWKGQMTTLIREFGGSAAWFGAYELTLDYFKSKKPAQKDIEFKPLELMTAGAMAGLGYNCLLFPIDTIKSIIQSRDVGDVSIWSVSKDVYRKYGVRGFYSGLGITIIKTIPASGIMFYTYETIKRQFC